MKHLKKIFEYTGDVTTRINFNEEDMFKAFEAGCELFHDDNDGRNSLSDKLVEKKFKEWINRFSVKESNDPKIQYKKENNKYFMRNPKGGKWVEISKEYYYKNPADAK